jgi:hypothetical protein
MQSGRSPHQVVRYRHEEEEEEEPSLKCAAASWAEPLLPLRRRRLQPRRHLHGALLGWARHQPRVASAADRPRRTHVVAIGSLSFSPPARPDEPRQDEAGSAAAGDAGGRDAAASSSGRAGPGGGTPADWLGPLLPALRAAGSALQRHKQVAGGVAAAVGGAAAVLAVVLRGRRRRTAGRHAESANGEGPGTRGKSSAAKKRRVSGASGGSAKRGPLLKLKPTPDCVPLADGRCDARPHGRRARIPRFSRLGKAARTLPPPQQAGARDDTPAPRPCRRAAWRWCAAPSPRTTPACSTPWATACTRARAARPSCGAWCPTRSAGTPRPGTTPSWACPTPRTAPGSTTPSTGAAASSWPSWRHTTAGRSRRGTSRRGSPTCLGRSRVRWRGVGVCGAP